MRRLVHPQMWFNHKATRRKQMWLKCTLSTAKTTHIAGGYKGGTFSAGRNNQLDLASHQSSSFTPTLYSSTSPLINNHCDMEAFKKTAPTSTASFAASHSGKGNGSQQDAADKSYPQCCHCSWRNAHAPDCIFYTGSK